jgi:hypothetical protein
MKFGSSIAACALLLLCGCQTTSGRGSIQVANGGSEAILRHGVTLASGMTARVGFATEINPDCSQRGPLPTVRVLRQPAHGALDVQTVSDYPTFARNNVRSACNKVRVSGVRITYRPQAGFVGQDSFAYEVFTSVGVMVHEEITASVM